MELTTVYDCIGANVGTFPVPTGVLMAGYLTGSGDVPWTPAQLAAHPGMVLIDQSSVNTAPDTTADFYDLEPLAGTLTGLPGWMRDATDSFTTGRRPGQRRPAVYESRSNVTPIVNTLIAAGIHTGVGLWLSEPMDAAQAVALVTTASGPFPFIGCQYQFLPTHNISVVSTAWLNDVSVKRVAPVIKPGTQTGWRWCFNCQGLFYGPQENRSHCPAGGMHNGSKSHEYTLGFDQ